MENSIVVEELITQFTQERKKGMDYSVVRKQLQAKKLSIVTVRYILDEVENNVLGIHGLPNVPFSFDFRRLLVPFFILILLGFLVLTFYYPPINSENPEEESLVSLKISKVIASIIMVFLSHRFFKNRKNKKEYQNRF